MAMETCRDVVLLRSPVRHKVLREYEAGTEAGGFAIGKPTKEWLYAGEIDILEICIDSISKRIQMGPV